MEIKIYPNGIYGATTYLIYNLETKEAIMIDCTCAIEEIKKFIQDNKLNLKYILITHGHFDHIYCLKKAKEAFENTAIMMNKDDLNLLDNIETQCTMAGIENVKLPCVDGLIDENTKNITFEGKEIKFIHTKGHSKGGMCYLINNVLFSGDTLFKDSIGRCDLWGGDFQEIETSIKEKLFTLDENIEVYPGHGEKTSIGYEKKYNPYFGENN